MTDHLSHQITEEYRRQLDDRPIGAGDVRAVMHAGQTQRRRRRARASAVTIGTLGVMLALALVLWPGDNPVVNTVDPARSTGSTAPYDVVPCPDQLPELEDANYRVPDLDRVVAVRSCADMALFFTDDDTVTAEDRAWLADRDALVHDIDDFVASLRSAPAYDPERCALLDIINTRASLAFSLDDGTQVVVAVPACKRLKVEGRTIDGQQLAEAFDNAVDRQRDNLAYTRATDRPLACQTPTVSAPVRPDREVVVAAAWCPAQDSTAVAIEGQALSDLAAAWMETRPVERQLDPSGMNTCTDLETRPAEVIIRTDRADDVRLMVSPCGFLVFGSWDTRESVAIPVTPRSLGLA